MVIGKILLNPCSVICITTAANVMDDGKPLQDDENQIMAGRKIGRKILNKQLIGWTKRLIRGLDYCRARDEVLNPRCVSVLEIENKVHLFTDRIERYYTNSPQ